MKEYLVEHEYLMSDLSQKIGSLSKIKKHICEIKVYVYIPTFIHSLYITHTYNLKILHCTLRMW